MQQRESFKDYGINVGYRYGLVSMQCPQCSPYRKNRQAQPLSVNTKDGWWRCHHCGWNGRLNDIQAQPQQIEIKKEEVVVKYARPKLVTPNYEVSDVSVGCEDYPEKFYDWFANRGLLPDTVRANHISLGKLKERIIGETGKETILELDVIQFPYYQKGVLINVKYRYLNEKRFRLYSGAELIFYCIDELEGLDECWIVEGEPDCLAMKQAGVKGVISVPNGAPSPDSQHFAKHFAYLEAAEETLRRMKRVVVMVDNDEAGRKLETELIRRLSAMIGQEKVWRGTWPVECKDANDCLMLGGSDAIKKVVDNITPVPIDGYVTLSDVATEMDINYQTGQVFGASTGWAALNGIFHLNTNRLVIVTGYPSMGKTQFTFSLATNIARDYGWHWCICSPEMRPARRIFTEIAKRYTGKPFYEGRVRERMDRDELEAAKVWMEDHFSILAPRQTPTMKQVFELARAGIYRKGTKGVILDPFNGLDHGDMGGRSETRYVGDVLSEAINFSETYDVVTIVVVHPIKAPKFFKDPDRKPGAPTLSDAVGSYNWWAKADVGITVHRDLSSSNNLTEVHVSKVRFEEDGKPGFATLRFDKATGRLLDVNSEVAKASRIVAETQKALGNGPPLLEDGKQLDIPF